MAGVEARLGARLLVRSTRALTLTAEGIAHLQAAWRILADLDDAEQLIVDPAVPPRRSGFRALGARHD